VARSPELDRPPIAGVQAGSRRLQLRAERLAWSFAFPPVVAG
jgi:hypothetical protein